MKRTVTITMDIDATEYFDTDDTPEGTIDLILAALRGDADLPERITVACDGVERHSNDLCEIA